MNDIDLIKSKMLDLKCTDTYVFSAIENIESKMKLLEKLQETLYSTELYLVYKHTAPNGKIYIGITKNSPNARWNEGAGYETQKKFYKAIQTFGWINFKHEIIAAGLSEKEAKILESKLILEYKSNEEEYGYNTQVLKSTQPETKDNSSVEAKNSINCTNIANQIIQKFSIKTIDDTIYYLSDEKYIREKDFPVIKKELLLTYQIESRKQKEIIEQIKILSFAKREEIFPPENSQENETNYVYSKDISAFFKKIVLEKHSHYFVSDEELYVKYISWANECDADTISKEEFFKKIPSWMKKFRPDICRIVTTVKTGWQLRIVMEDLNSSNILTSRAIEEISDWLNSTDVNVVCVPMICEKALGIKSKGSRRIGNEICYALRNIITGWKEIGVQHTREYGNQLCFTRK